MESDDLFVRYQEIQSYVGWDAADEKRAAFIGSVVHEDFPSIIADFYDQIRKTPGAFRVISGGLEQISRLQKTLLAWLDELFRGPYDENYVRRRWRIGYRHVEIGLSQNYVNAAVSRLRHGLSVALANRWDDTMPNLGSHQQTLHRLLDLELAIIEQAYRDEFQRRDQQVQRLATLGQVSSGIAHELRNPLNVIKTSTYFLLNARQPSDEKRQEHLERIERQVDMASEVISAISEFAKVADPALEELDLAEQLSGWLSQVGGLESTVVQHEASCTSPVLGDSRLLQIVIANILRNASEAMEGKGQVDVTLKENGEHVRLEFVDSGPGIPLDIRARVTEPWFSTKARGTGLGLAITKAILDRHQADLQIEDGEQGGTRMQIDIPKASFVRTSGELS